MNLEKVNKNLPELRNVSNTIDNTGIDSEVSDCAAGGENEASTSGVIPRTKMGKFFFAESKDIQAGPTLKFKEPLRIDNIKHSDLVNINEMCRNCERDAQEKTMKGKFMKIEKNWTVKKCFMSVIMITLIEIIVLACLHCASVRENDVDFIDVSSINRMHGNLRNFVTREKWLIGYNDTNDCTYECPKLKSKLRFVLLPHEYFNCKSRDNRSGDKLCSYHLMKNIKEFWKSYTDIYYNYIITGEDLYIYEGRHLTCPYDEHFLEEDHTSMITVGIDYCFPGRSEKNSEFSLKVTDEISDLITNLKEQEIVSTDYVLDFPDECDKSFLMERIERVPTVTGRITFYKSAVYKNLKVSTELNPTRISTLLFLPKYTVKKESISIPQVKLVFPLSSNISIENIDYSTDIRTITLRFYYLDSCMFDADMELSRINFRIGNSGKNFVRNIWPLITGFLGGEISGFEGSIGNYYLFKYWDVVYGQIPVNFPSNLNNSKPLVNIFVVDLPLDNLTRNEMILLTEALNSIRNDVRKRIKYSKVEYQFSCDVSPTYKESVLYIYDYLLDTSVMRYVKFAPSQNFTIARECKYIFDSPGQKIIPEIKSRLLFLPNDTIEIGPSTRRHIKLEFPFPSDISINNIDYSTQVRRITLRFYFIHSKNVGLDEDFTQCRSVENFLRNCWPRIMIYLDKYRPSFDSSIGNYHIFNYLDVIYGQIPVNYSSNINQSDLVINIFQSYYNKDHKNNNRIVWFAQVMDSIRDDIMKRIKYSKVDFQFVCHDNTHYSTAEYIYLVLLDRIIIYVKLMASGYFSYTTDCAYEYNYERVETPSVIKSKLLFLPEDTVEDDLPLSPDVKLLFPFPSNISINNIDYSTKVKRLSIRFFFKDIKRQDLYRHFKCRRSGENFVRNCWPVMMSHLNAYRSSFNKSIGNYYLLHEFDVVYGQIPVDYPRNVNHSDVFVNVYLSWYNYFKSTDSLIRFAQVMHSIRTDVTKRTKYSQVDVKFACRFSVTPYAAIQLYGRRIFCT